MNNSLKRELAFVAGTLGFLLAKRRSGQLMLAASVALLWSSTKRSFNYRGKTVFITGGSRGLGLSLAWNLLKLGATVTLAARDEEELEKARQILLRDFPYGIVHTTVCDVTNSYQLRASLDAAVERMNGIDLLINNAGAILVGPFTSMTKDDFVSQMNVHLFSAIDATDALIPQFKKRGAGRVLNICSIGGKVAMPHMLPYDASKFALAGYSQGITAELARHNIQVTTAYPSVMRTGSPKQALFKGEHEKEFLWFKAIDNLPGLSLSADTAAKKLLDAVADGRTEVVLSVPGRLRVLFQALFPETATTLMGVIARLLPRGNSPIQKTGAQSSRLFDKSYLLSGLNKRDERAQETYNQLAEHDFKNSQLQ